MSSLPVNGLDIFVLIVLLLSGLLAFARGFVHEVLAIAGWVGAAFATLYGTAYAHPYAKMALKDIASSKLIIDIAAGGAIFLMTLVILSLVTRAISHRVRESALNALDRSLGFLFGLARGGLLLCLAYLLLGWIMPRDEQPNWISNARSRPLIEQGADLLEALAPTEAGERAAREAADTARKADETRRMVDKLMHPETKAPEGQRDGSYGKSERSEMDRLIQNSQ